jgi:hypothetical protein
LSGRRKKGEEEEEEAEAAAGGKGKQNKKKKEKQMEKKKELLEVGDRVKVLIVDKILIWQPGTVCGKPQSLTPPRSRGFSG